MAKGAYSVVIEAVDRYSKPIDDFNKKLRAANAPFAKMSKSLAQLGKDSGLDKVGKAFRDIGGSAAGAFGSITRILDPLGVITGVASVAGMYALVSAWAAWDSKLGYTAERMGVSVSHLNDYQNAARLAGVSSEAMASGLTTLKDKMTDALGPNASGETMGYFLQLGLSLKDLHGSVESVLPKIISRIGELERSNPTLAARLTRALFGSEELLRAFRGGLPAFDRYLAQARQLSHFTQDQANRADSLRQSQVAVTESVENFANVLSANLQPVLGPVLDFMAAWIAANSQWISQDIAYEVGQFIDYLRHVDWMGVAKRLDDWYRRIKRVVDMLGGAGNVFMGLAALMATGFALKLLSPFLALAGALDGVLFKLGAVILKARSAQIAAAAVTAASGAGSAAGGAAAAAGGSTLAGTVAAGALRASAVAVAGTVGAVAAGAALTAITAYFVSHGLGWLFGQGWNGDTPAFSGPLPNASNRGHDPRAAPRSGASGPQRGIDQSATGNVLEDTGATQAQFDAYKKAVASKEQSRYDQMGGFHNAYAGRYQMGHDEIVQTARQLGVPVPTQQQFLADPAMQERFMDAFTDAHARELMRTSKQFYAATPAQRLAILGYAHNQGDGGATAWMNTGQVGRDGFGTAGTDFSNRVDQYEAALPSVATAPPVGAAAPAAGAPAQAPPAAAAGAPGASGKVTLEVNAKPGTEAKVTKTEGNVAATPGVATSNIGYATST